MTIQEKLYETRLLNGYIKPEVAKLGKFSKQHINNIEMGVYEPSEDLLNTLAKIYHVNADDLASPVSSPIDILPPEYYLPGVTVLVHDKTPSQLQQEQEYAKLPTARERFKAILDMYDLTYTDVAKAVGVSARVIMNAANSTVRTPDVTYMKLAKALGLDPFYFDSSIEEREAARKAYVNHRLQKQKEHTKRPVVVAHKTLEEIEPVSVEESSDFLKTREHILQRPDISDRYSRLFKLYKLSTTQLAQAIGVNPISLSRICNGETTPSADTRNRIAKYLGINPNELLASNGTVAPIQGSAAVIPAKPSSPATPVPPVSPSSAPGAIENAILTMKSSYLPVLVSQFLMQAAKLFSDPSYTESRKDALLMDLDLFYNGVTRNG